MQQVEWERSIRKESLGERRAQCPFPGDQRFLNMALGRKRGEEGEGLRKEWSPLALKPPFLPFTPRIEN